MTWADFTGATLRGFTKEQLYLTASYQAKNLSGMRLSSNDLSGWDFSGQNLSNALIGFNSTLTDANLTGANLTNAILGDSTLTSANLTGASLTNANLEFVQDLPSAVFSSSTVYNQRTVFPDGFDPVSAGLTLMRSRAGDFDVNGALDVDDIDNLMSRIFGGSSLIWVRSTIFDVNGDTMINHEDLRVWVSDLKHTRRSIKEDVKRPAAYGRYSLGWANGFRHMFEVL